MALRSARPRPNRYKKNGKGGFALAVFVVLLCLLAVGGFLFKQFQSRQGKAVRQSTAPASAARPEPPPSAQQRHSSIVPQVIEAVPPSRQEPYYTGDLDPEQKPLPRPRPLPAGAAELAVVIDDMGSSLQEARALASIGVPITFAVIPGLRHDREVAAVAGEQGIEVLLHMPMQSREYPRRRLEENGLLLEHGDDELRSRVAGYLQRLPGVVGANNHMGSGFTEQGEKMRVVLGVLQQHGLFFLDSITTPRTTGLKVAAELRMRSARRDVFLDNEQQESYIRGQLAQAVSRARKRGHAVAIGHPHPVTIAVLTRELPLLAGQGVTLVPVSRMAH